MRRHRLLSVLGFQEVPSIILKVFTLPKTGFIPSAILRLSLCFVLVPGLAGCGVNFNGGSSGSPTIVTYTFTGPAPIAVAAQIGSGAYAQSTLTSGKLTLSVPSGESNFSVAYLCPSPAAGPFVNEEYVNEASTLDGTSFSETCIAGGDSSQGGLATAQVNATAIPGAEGISIGQQGCSACNTFNLDEDLAVGTYDVPVYVTGAGGIYEAIAARILRNQTIPGALNGGAPVVFETSDETVPQTITYLNVPNGYSPGGGQATYYTADGTWVPLVLGSIPAATQYMAMPAGSYQSGDYYEFNVEANNATGNAAVSVERYTSSAGPQSFTFPAPLSYAGPAAAALPTFNFAYSGFSGMSNISQQAAIDWGLGTWAFGVPADFDSIHVTATANYQNGSTAMTVPDLSSLTGFLAAPPSGSKVVWTAGFIQGDPFVVSPPSGDLQSVVNSGSYTVP